MPNYGPAPSARPGLPTMVYEDDTFAGRGRMGQQTPRVHFEDEYGDDDTENIEYTTEIRAALRNAGPRRRKTRRVEIHEDIGPTAIRPTALSQPRRSSLKGTNIDNPPRQTLLSQPAHRKPAVLEAKPTRRRVSAVLGERKANLADTAASGNQPDTMRRQYEDLFDISRDEMYGDNNLEAGRPGKDPRRRTIYVPSEDTTIMTIHPGASLRADDRGRLASKHVNLDLVTVSEDDEEMADHIKRRAARKSLAAAPRRAPLSQVSKVNQGQPSSLEIAGAGSGKENIPPNGKETGKKKGASKIVITIDEQKPEVAKKHSQNKAAKAPLNRSRLESIPDQKPTQHKAVGLDIIPPNFQGSPISRKRTSSESADSSGRSKFLKQRKDAPSLADEQPTGAFQMPKHSGVSRLSPPDRRTSPRPERQTRKPEKVPSKLSVPIVLQLAQEHQDKYPILLENISRPEMYEDNWLNHQEEAITQLINGLFDSATSGQLQQMGFPEKQNARRALLGLYQQPSFPLLYKRLQASLLYGALSIPKELLSKTIHLKDDVGFKRKFLTLWVETYEPSALRAASEVVIGREITQVPRNSHGGSSENDERRAKAEKKSIETFLDIFLVRNEDAVRPKNTVGSIGNIARGNSGAPSLEGNVSDFGSQGWAWRRTVLRSLMLVLLLDMGKARETIGGCLFLKSSPHKSTTSVLQALSNLVLPSLGDITRPLGHLNYHATHIQYPLEEYDYKITNLATDIRDGVRLTRLVELLLYPPSSLLRENDITVTMPTGDILTTASNHADSWVLSHHLKFPCIGRAQKVYNVQVALAALQGVRGGTANQGGVKAEEIVDGHREKTVGLLWGLVSKWGLGTLIDWAELRKEVRRLRLRLRLQEQRAKGAEATNQGECDESEDDEEEVEFMHGLERYTYMLRGWASVIARLHGKKVTNLTTCFADGVIFEKIVDEYEVYFPLQQQVRPAIEGRHAQTLEGKLRRLGCSNYFSGLFGRNVRSGRVFDKDFVLAGLAFMCSRLLQASIRGRAAMTIQRAYRQSVLRRQVHERAVLLKLAHDCQTVVVTRDRVIRAAQVIQRAYRRHLHKKIDRLVSCVTSFQAHARGGIARRKFRFERLNAKRQGRGGEGGGEVPATRMSAQQPKAKGKNSSKLPHGR